MAKKTIKVKRKFRHVGFFGGIKPAALTLSRLRWGTFGGPARYLTMYAGLTKFLLQYEDMWNNGLLMKDTKFEAAESDKTLCRIACERAYNPLTVKQLLGYDLLIFLVLVIIFWGLECLWFKITGGEDEDRGLLTLAEDRMSTKILRRARLFGRTVCRLTLISIIVVNQFYLGTLIRDLVYNMTNGRSWFIITPTYICLTPQRDNYGCTKNAHRSTLAKLNNTNRGYPEYYFFGMSTRLNDAAIERYQKNFWYNLHYRVSSRDGAGDFNAGYKLESCTINDQIQYTQEQYISMTMEVILIYCLIVSVIVFGFFCALAEIGISGLKCLKNKEEYEKTKYKKMFSQRYSKGEAESESVVLTRPANEPEKLLPAVSLMRDSVFKSVNTEGVPLINNDQLSNSSEASTATTSCEQEDTRHQSKRTRIHISGAPDFPAHRSASKDSGTCNFSTSHEHQPQPQPARPMAQHHPWNYANGLPTEPIINHQNVGLETASLVPSRTHGGYHASTTLPQPRPVNSGGMRNPRSHDSFAS